MVVALFYAFMIVSPPSSLPQGRIRLAGHLAACPSLCLRIDISTNRHVAYAEDDIPDRGISYSKARMMDGITHFPSVIRSGVPNLCF